MVTSKVSVRSRCVRYFILIFLFVGLGAHASTHLFLIGGGTLPKTAISRFAEQAGGKNGTILMINWASGETPESELAWLTKAVSTDVPAGARPNVIGSVTRDLVSVQKADLIAQIKSSTGIFFTGGDQSRIMDILIDPAFSDVKELFQKRYQTEGIPFAGTSAGMAIMSVDMFTGDEDPKLIDPNQPKLSRAGLGLLPGVMVDTHFLVRQRENRLFSYLVGHQVPLAMGINEDGAVEVTDNQVAEVVGPTQIMVVDTVEHPGDFLVKILKPGDSFDLVKRRPITG